MIRPRSCTGRAVALSAIAFLAIVACSACSPYLVRRDTLSDASGDAVDANIAKQVIDPWPREASRIDRTTSGERAARAVERYRNPQTGPNAFSLGAAPPPSVAVGAAPPGLR